jgi:threonine dehydrogenase-like Zn-dependent dehydrogenase
MKAITVEPKQPNSARLENIAEPDEREGSVLVEAIAVGVCGTDVEIADGSLITRREPPEKFAQALVRNPSDIKVVIQFAAAQPAEISTP